MSVKIKLNVGLGQYPKDTILNIETDEKGVPLDRYWRRRFIDSEIDNCIETISDKKPTKKSIKKEISK